MKLKIVSTFFVAALLAALSVSGLAAPTPEQQAEIKDCGVMAEATLLFAEARDQGLSKPDAFKSVTHGQSVYLAGSPVDKTEQWAYDHPDEQADTVSAHFLGHCVLGAFDLLTPATEAEIQSDAAACQKDHAGKPDDIRACINAKTQALIDAGGAQTVSAPAAGTGTAAAPTIAHERPPSLTAIGKISLGMSIADARKAIGHSGEVGTDDQGAEDYTYMISHDHGFVVVLTAPGDPKTVYGVEYHGGADVDMDPVLGIRLGDNAAALVSKVGEPTSRQPIPDSDDTLWSYDDRNYSFIVSSGGDVIAIRIYGYTGVKTEVNKDQTTT